MKKQILYHVFIYIISIILNIIITVSTIINCIAFIVIITDDWIIKESKAIKNYINLFKNKIN